MELVTRGWTRGSGTLLNTGESMSVMRWLSRLCQGTPSTEERETNRSQNLSSPATLPAGPGFTDGVWARQAVEIRLGREPKGGSAMSHKNLFKRQGCYPFARKTRFHPTDQRCVDSPAIHPSMVRALGRFPHWDRPKPAKGH